jgi:hypothetical protein
MGSSFMRVMDSRDTGGQPSFHGAYLWCGADTKESVEAGEHTPIT